MASRSWIAKGATFTVTGTREVYTSASEAIDVARSIVSICYQHDKGVRYKFYDARAEHKRLEKLRKKVR